MAYVSTDLASMGSIVSNSKVITFYVYDSTDNIAVAGYFADAASTTGDGQLNAGDLIFNPTTGLMSTVSDAAAGSVQSQGSGTKKISIGFADGLTSNDTGWDLPANAIVRDVYVNVLVAEATGATTTIDVGLLPAETGGDKDGFVDGLDVSATGITIPSVVNGAVTYGTFLVVLNGGAGVNHIVGYPADENTAKSVSWERGDGTTDDWAEFSGELIIVYDLV